MTEVATDMPPLFLLPRTVDLCHETQISSEVNHQPLTSEVISTAQLLHVRPVVSPLLNRT